MTEQKTAIDQQFEFFLERSCLELGWAVPEFPTQMGMFEIGGQAVPQNRFTSIDVDSRRQRQMLFQRLSRELLAFTRDDLCDSSQISAEVLEFFLKYAHERGLVGTEGAELQDREYLIRPSVGLQSELPLFLTDLHPMRDAGDAEGYVQRLSEIAPQIRYAASQLNDEHSCGAAPPDFLIHDVIDEIQRFVASRPAENSLLTTFDEKTSDIGDLDERQRQTLLSDALSELQENTYPAYDDLARALHRVAADAHESPGVWRLPDGEAWYDFQLRAATTTEMTADDVHELGLEETARLEGEIVAACRDVGLTVNNIGDCHRELNKRNKSPREDTTENRNAIVARVESLIREIEPQLSQFFHTLPRGEVVVKPMPKFAEANRNQSYQPPSLDGSRAGFFELNVGQLLRESDFELPILVYHEIFPGHHLQIALAQEMENLPSLRRIITFDAYIEGWAKYAELMPSLHGLNDDPYFRISRMRRELVSTINLALDTGIHRKRWDKRRAMQFFAEHSGMSDDFCRYIVHRSASVPAQMCAYKMGMLKVLEMRRRMESTLGDQFDVKDFHHTVLKHGSVPLTLLENLVDKEIEQRVSRT